MVTYKIYFIKNNFFDYSNTFTAYSILNIFSNNVVKVLSYKWTAEFYAKYGFLTSLN